MNIFLRRQGLGLESIKNITEKMVAPAKIFRVDLGNRLVEHNFAFNWGNVNFHRYSFQNVVNKPDAISEISNKGTFRTKLYSAGLSMLTLRDRQEVLTHIAEGKRFVVRPSSHFGGKDTYLVDSIDTLNSAILRCGRFWYASEYIPKVSEYRVFITQGRVVYVVQKIVQDTAAIAWNVHQGGHFENVRFDDWNLRVVRVSVEAFNLSSLDFGAVDVIVDNQGKVFVLEINSAPAMTSEYWTKCVASSFDYIISNGLTRIGLIEERGGWRKFVHPSLSDEALLPNTPNETPTQRRTEMRDVVVTENVAKNYRWKLSFSGLGVGRRVTDTEYQEMMQQISDTILSGERSGTARRNIQQTRTVRREFEI